MKTVTLIVRQGQISKFAPDGLQLPLGDDASVVGAIKAFDRELIGRMGKFPVKGFRSLLHMVYNPVETRFYKQVAVQAYVDSKTFLQIRENPKMSLPDKTTIILIPEGGCATDWEEPVDQEMEKEE